MNNFKNTKLNSVNSLGVIHIHSVFSDGTGAVDRISKAAKDAGLDWIIITDHNSFEVKEGFYNGVYVIKGEEISPQGGNHYLALGINKCIEPSDNVKQTAEAVKSSGGFGFAAHPDESENRKNAHSPIRWTDKSISPDGIEIWNWFSEWTDNLNDGNIFSLAYAYLFKHKLVKEPVSETLKWWDDLNNRTGEIVPAIGGADAHALKISKYVIPVTIFPYKTMFKTITNVICLDKPLSKDFELGKAQILDAVKSGRNLIVNRAVSKDIPQFIVSNSQETVCAGEKIPLDENTSCSVSTNKNSLIKIFLNGYEIKKVISNGLNLLIKERGKYRVEIKIGKRGFAYSNPITVY